ncbi:S8/S53 family peptidase [Sessilibacter sp. MAH4]
MRKILKSTAKITVGAAVLLAVQSNMAFADQASAPGQLKKLGSALMQVSANSAKTSGKAMGLMGPKDNEMVLAEVTADGYVLVDAVASGETAKLVAMLEKVGARNISSYGRVVSAQVPASSLGDMALSDTLAFAKPAFMETNVGVVTQQGDRSMGTDINRALAGLSGEGFTVGVLSDSFDCNPGSLAGGLYTTPDEDVANGDLPATFRNLEPIGDPSGCTDEGRAMAQLIVDAVPGVNILFHTAFNGQASFAEGIVELARAGADVIVDDVIYFTEPMFQDGIIAQAADEVARLGVPYYSSNGNRARDAFETEYRATTATIDGVEGVWHDFDPGEGVDLLKTITFGGALQTNMTFQWDSPSLSAGGVGAQNDVDVVMFDENGVRVPDCFVFQAENGFFPPLCQFQFTDGGGNPIDGGAGGDAIEFVSLVDFVGGSTVQLGFLAETGDAPGFVKYVLTGGAIVESEYPVDAASGFGHNNAAGAEGVAAAAFFFTEEFIGDANTNTLRAGAGEPECVPACLNDFSSAGGTPIFFDVAGNRLPAPEIRFKPGLTAPDGANTSFFFSDTSRDDDDSDGEFVTGEAEEFPNFFGTSAAAPSASAVAVQMLAAVTAPILTTRPNGEVLYNMCRPLFGERKYGVSFRVREEKVDQRLEQGFLLGRCDRPDPQDIYHVMRETADDMTIRASLGTGATVQVFDEVGPEGFDFDSGFGFVNAPAAVKAIKKKQHYGHFPYFKKFY